MRIIGLSGKTFALLLVAAVFALFLGYKLSEKLGLTYTNLDVDKLSATVFSQPRAITSFSLLDTDNQPFNNQSLQGHWSLLFFGFTNCGYICPTTMAELNKVYEQLVNMDKVTAPNVVMVSVDPERDSIEKMKQYVTSFNPAFQGATGSLEQISQLSNSMNVLYMKVDKQNTAKNKTGYDIEHSGSVMLIDPQGQLYAIFTPPLDVTKMVQDLAAIEKHYRT